MSEVVARIDDFGRPAWITLMVLGFMAMSNRISWGWPIGAIIGIAVIFGAPQIVTWIRGMFAV